MATRLRGQVALQPRQAAAGPTTVERLVLEPEFLQRLRTLGYVE